MGTCALERRMNDHFVGVNLGKSHGTVKIERPLHNFRCLVLRLYPAANHHTPPAPRLRFVVSRRCFICQRILGVAFTTLKDRAQPHRAHQ